MAATELDLAMGRGADSLTSSERALVAEVPAQASHRSFIASEAIPSSTLNSAVKSSVVGDLRGSRQIVDPQ